MRSSFSLSLLYHAYVYLEFLILACTIYILASHVPTWLYKLGGRLDKQYEEIVSALSDINAFNAGKKRDKALELIAAWLPDVEKFSKGNQ